MLVLEGLQHVDRCPTFSNERRRGTQAASRAPENNKMVWLWDADAAQAFLASFGISREIPGLDGPALLLRVDQLGFSDAEKEHVQAALTSNVYYEFLQ